MKTFTFRSLQVVLAVSSVFLLTGAKGEGCGTSIFVEPPPPPPPLECPMGTHAATVCDDGVVIVQEESTTSSSSGSSGSSSGSSGSGGASSTGGWPGPDEPPNPGVCHEECIADDPCPPGTMAQWSCGGGGPDEPVCMGDGCPEPTPCELICVPPSCPPGTHEEWTCGGGGFGESSSSSSSSSGSSSGSPGDQPPVPVEECVMSCVDDECPPGTMLVTYCEHECGDENENVCWSSCEPMGNPEED